MRVVSWFVLQDPEDVSEPALGLAVAFADFGGGHVHTTMLAGVTGGAPPTSHSMTSQVTDPPVS